jgi:tyrosine-protein phosphatase non-receptor type 4
LSLHIYILYASLLAVYEAHGDEEEPPYQYVPDLPHVAAVTDQADALAESMLLLADGLASGALVAQFEQLYRKKPGLSADEAKKSENQNKNRYRDISPCTYSISCTQVKVPALHLNFA